MQRLVAKYGDDSGLCEFDQIEISRLFFQALKRREVKFQPNQSLTLTLLALAGCLQVSSGRVNQGLVTWQLLQFVFTSGSYCILFSSVTFTAVCSHQ